MLSYIIKLFSSKAKCLNCILFGLYIYYWGHLFHNYIFVNEKWTRVFNLIGFCIIIYGFFKIKKSVQKCEPGFLFVYYFYILVCVINVIIGVPLMINDGRLSELISDPQSMGMYLIGFAFLIPVKLSYVRQVIRWAFLYAFTSLVFSLFFFNDLFIDASQILHSMIGWDGYVLGRPQEPAILLMPIAAFFIFFTKFPIKYRVFLVIAFFFALCAAALSGRRGVAAILFGYLIIAICFHLLKEKRRLIISCLIMLLAIIPFVQYGGLDNIDKIFEENFVILYERMNEDTRKGVEVDFYKDMVETYDWIIGRGMAGTYKSVELSEVDRLHRTVVETGYLNIILHGGLLMLVPYILLLLYSFFRGFFFSNNSFLKSCALFVLYHFFLLYPSGHLRLTLEVFILFIFMRICMSPRWRNMSNQDIDEHIFKSVIS